MEKIKKKRKRAGDVLIERGVVDQQTLDQALQKQEVLRAQRQRARLGELLMEVYDVSPAEIIAALEEAAGLTYTSCKFIDSTDEALRLVPRPLAVKTIALPLKVVDNCLVVVMAEPQNLSQLDELKFCSGKTITPLFSLRKEILAAIDRMYSGPLDEFSISPRPK